MKASSRHKRFVLTKKNWPYDWPYSKEYEVAISILADYFNDGEIPMKVNSKGGYLLGIATVFANAIRKGVK